MPDQWIGKTVGELDIRNSYHINIMAVRTNGKLDMVIKADTMFRQDETLMVLGHFDAIKKCFHI